MNITQESEDQYTDLKKLKLVELRALQDLIYGDCMRDDRTLKDVVQYISIMRVAFNIKEQRQGTMNTTETEY